MPLKENCDVLHLLGTHSPEQYEVFKIFQDILKNYGKNVCFVSFEDGESSKIGNKFSYFSSTEMSLDSNIVSEARRLESKYEFTFQHITYPEQVQQQRSTKLNEQKANEIRSRLKDYLYLEDLVQQLQPELILRGQGTISTNYFAGRLAEALDITQAIFTHDFFNRMVFFKSLSGECAEIYDIDFNPEITETDVEMHIHRYIDSGILPFSHNNSSNRTWKSYLLDLFENPKKITEIPHWCKRKLRKKRRRGELYVPSLIKSKMYSKLELTEKYLFLPFHLPTESTNVHRSHPYINQVSLTEYISRNLPYDIKLYVREHPHHPGKFGIKFIRKLTKIPNVRVINPNIDINTILENSQGVIVLNNTTGYEALMHNKPVVALSSSPYTSHKNVFHVENPYNIDKKIINAYNHNVNKEDVVEFLTKMFRSSIDITLKSSQISDQQQIQTIGSNFGEAVQKIVEDIKKC